MGPNLYITPPGSFTRFHQDVMGHSTLALPDGCDKDAFHVKEAIFSEMPHADGLVSFAFGVEPATLRFLRRS